MIFPPTSLTTLRTSHNGSAQGVVSDENFQESDVWFKRNGEWKVVPLHDSPAPQIQ